MKYAIDNDLHIHSKFSICANDPEQTPERILQYAKDNGLKTICLTDHFWDDNVKGPEASEFGKNQNFAFEFYKKQNFEHISAALPLPQDDDVRFLFGCEAELDRFLTLGVADKTMEKLDFIVVPTTHFHMTGFTISEEEAKNTETRAKAWQKHFEAVLSMKLPFKKLGIAHLTCEMIAPSRAEFLETLERLPEDELKKLFVRAADVGVGIELNASDMDFADNEAEIILRPYRAAKEAGCKFYLGSDAHHPDSLSNSVRIFERAVDLLNLTEDDKFILR